MADLQVLASDIKRISEMIDEMADQQKKSIQETEIDFDAIWSSANSRSFDGHILTYQNEEICKQYMAVLAAMIQLSQNTEKRVAQIRFIARILVVQNVDLGLKDILLEGMMLTEKGMDALRTIKDKEIQTALLSDLLILCYLDGQPEEKQIHFAVGYLELLGLSQNTVIAICNAVKGILEQNDTLVLDQYKSLSIGYLYCYMKNPPDAIMTGNLNDARRINAKKVIIKELETNEGEVIDCEQYKAEIIEFSSCTFTGLKQFYNKTKMVILRNCIFKNCEIQDTLILTKNTEFINCKFIDIFTYSQIDNSYVLVLDNCKMNECIFKGINLRYVGDGYKYDGGFLLMKNSVIKDSVFEDIKSVNNGRSNTYYMVNLYGGRLSRCSMKNCIMEGYFYAVNQQDNADCDELTFQEYKCNKNMRDYNRVFALDIMTLKGMKEFMK